MYRVQKRMEIAGSHCLDLPYESKCKEQHGHNWIITIEIESENLNQSGMVFDFAIIKKLIKNALDHKCINEVMPSLNPTAENIALWIERRLWSRMQGIDYDEYKPRVSKVTVQESEGNTACYIP